MPTLVGFTRPSDPVNGGQLSGQVSAAIGITVDAQVDSTQAVVSGAISEANRVAIQNAINAYIYLPPSVGNPTITTKVALGLGNVTNTADADKPVSTEQATAIGAKADSSALGGKADLAEVSATVGAYRTIMEASGSHIAARVAGTYALSFGSPLAISGTGTLYPIQVMGLLNAENPTVNGMAPKLRVRGLVTVNNVAPTGNYTLGLYPVTKGAGAAGLSTYTLGAVVAGSQPSTIVAPAAQSMQGVIGADFAFPADGIYCLGVVTTATVATSSLVHVVARLQVRNA